jgi:hypothetical protein
MLYVKRLITAVVIAPSLCSFASAQVIDIPVEGVYASQPTIVDGLVYYETGQYSNQLEGRRTTDGSLALHVGFDSLYAPVGWSPTRPTIYAGNGGNSLFAVVDGRALYCFNLEGNFLWCWPKDDPWSSTYRVGTPSVTPDGQVYVADKGKSVIRLRQSDGQMELKGPGCDCRGTPAVLDGRVYMATGEGMAVLNAADLSVMASFPAGGEMSSPYVAGNHVFASIGNRIYKLNRATLTPDQTFGGDPLALGYTVFPEGETIRQFIAGENNLTLYAVSDKQTDPENSYVRLASIRADSGELTTISTAESHSLSGIGASGITHNRSMHTPAFSAEFATYWPHVTGASGVIMQDSGTTLHISGWPTSLAHDVVTNRYFTVARPSGYDPSATAHLLGFDAPKG